MNKEIQILEEIANLDCLSSGDTVKGTCLSVWERKYSGKWTYIESRNWLALRTNGNSIATLEINEETRPHFKFEKGKFYIKEDTGFHLDFFNPKTEEIGQEINDYLEKIENE